jgi:hypothetical protein
MKEEAVIPAPRLGQLENNLGLPPANGEPVLIKTDFSIIEG